MTAQRFEPQEGERGLVPHPHRFVLRGEAASLAFPPLCPNCGRAADDRVDCSKVFVRSDDETTRYIVSTARVPFCAACRAEHDGLRARRRFADDLLASFSTGHMLGAVFPALAAAFVVHLVLDDLMKGRVLRAATMLLIAAFFGAIAWLQWRAVWGETAHLRVPPATRVTQAFDFSDDLASVFETRRFACTVRDAAFAGAFGELNRERAWVEGSAEAVADKRRATRKMWIFGIVIAIIILAGLVRDYLHG